MSEDVNVLQRVDDAIRAARVLDDLFGVPAGEAEELIRRRCPDTETSWVLGRVQVHVDMVLKHYDMLLEELNYRGVKQ